MNERFKEPALYAGEIDEDIDLTMPPATGAEYIKRVMLEAQKCEDVVCAKIDEARLNKPVLNVNSLPECSKAPESVIPSLEWQNCQIADFSNVRMYIAQIRDEITIGKRKRISSEDNLPNPSDQNGWINACTAPEEEQSPYIEPTLTVILTLNQPTVEHVLEHLVEYLEDKQTIEPQLGRWLYSLLAALELPLIPDMCSCLRSLARTCSTMRSQLDSSKANEALSLNLFICLVARYFRQLDLADQ